MTLGSTTTATRNFYLIQPYTARSRPCTADGVTLSNKVVADPSVSMFLYTPCVIRKANLSTLTGQVYAGNHVALDNQLTMNDSAMPVYGVTDGAGAGQFWRVDLLAKRENQ